MDDKGAAVILEDINDKLETILEGQVAMAAVPEDIKQLKSDMTEVKGDIKVIKAAVTDLTHETNNLKIRTSALEQVSP